MQSFGPLDTVVQFQRDYPEAFERAYKITHDIDILAKISDHISLFAIVVSKTDQLFDRKSDAQTKRSRDHKYLIAFTDLGLYSPMSDKMYQKLMTLISAEYVRVYSISGHEMTVRCDNYEVISKAKIDHDWIKPAKPTGFVTFDTKYVYRCNSVVRGMEHEIDTLCYFVSSLNNGESPSNDDRERAMTAYKHVIDNMGRLNEFAGKMVTSMKQADPVQSDNGTYACVICDTARKMRFAIVLCKDPEAHAHAATNRLSSPIEVVFKAKCNPDIPLVEPLHNKYRENIVWTEVDTWLQLDQDALIFVLMFARAMCEQNPQ